MLYCPLTKKRTLVADNLYLPVSRHFYPSFFGVRGRYENAYKSGNYICTGKPGTGFFARESDSHSYRRFVHEVKKNQEQSFFTLILGREFNFDKELKELDVALNGELSVVKSKILYSYQNSLMLAKEEELLQRVVRALKDKLHHQQNKYLTSLLSHYKSRIASLQHDVKGAQIELSDLMSAESFAKWESVVDAFHTIVDARRVWHVEQKEGQESYTQVFFDLGVFDFIHSNVDTPLLRDASGQTYYLYPWGIVCNRSSIDFDVIPLEEIDFEYRVVDLNTLNSRPEFNSNILSHKKHRHIRTDALSTLYGTTRTMLVGQLHISKLNLDFFCNHTEPVQNFVNQINQYKDLHYTIDYDYNPEVHLAE